MELARQIFARYASSTDSTVAELLPGSQYETPDQLIEWVKYNSWGHHARCMSPVGHGGDRMAVLDRQFRVRGASGLRVVDTSVSPRILGY